MNKKAKAEEMGKPFLNGAPKDENTVRNALKFFGAILLVAFVSFIVCSMTSFSSVILRIGINLLIEILILYIFFTKGINLGTEGVSRGEILYQHVQKGIAITEKEKKIPFHKAKGFIIGFSGTVLFIIAALILAFTAQRQMTGAGTLPSWMDAYMRRSEVSGALISYTQGVSVTVTDIIRIFIRMMIMPFVSMCGSENRDLLLIMERFSPLLVSLPAVAYGTGYLQGPVQRKKIHTEIAANARKRSIREKKEKKAKNARKTNEPQQLN